MCDNNHISQNDINTFQANTMNPQDMEKFLEHICSCDYCSEQFANCMEKTLVSAPIDMKANLLKAAKRPEVQLEVRIRETSKRMQLMIYSLKVGTATIGALLVLLLTTNFNGILTSTGDGLKNIPQRITINRDNNSSLTSSLKEDVEQFSNNIMNFINKEDLK